MALWMLRCDCRVAVVDRVDGSAVPCGEVPGPTITRPSPACTAERVSLGSFEAAEAMSANRFVRFTAAGQIEYADAASGKSAQGFIVGAVEAGASIAVYGGGDMPNLVDAQPGSTYFLGDQGQKTLAVPVSPASAISQIVGFGESATNLTVSLGIPITLAL